MRMRGRARRRRADGFRSSGGGCRRDLRRRLRQIKHFFEQYKALEKGKWVKVEGWDGIDAAHKEINDGVANFKK
ncbi:inorganic pyrophosphatase [Burkholderia pseudomallei]|nr:inorganic pyrophosphatase [Burkholderia pseudomallei]